MYITLLQVKSLEDLRLKTKEAIKNVCNWRC